MLVSVESNKRGERREVANSWEKVKEGKKKEKKMENGRNTEKAEQKIHDTRADTVQLLAKCNKQHISYFKCH